MRKGLILVVCVIALMSVAIFVPNIDAYDRYDSCQSCHGSFTGNTSPKGTEFPSNNKHLMHRSNQYMAISCDLCHSSGDGDNPFIGSSDGTGNNPGLGCTGCHEGPGLRAHHEVSAVPSCLNCHQEESPNPENIWPTYYGTSDTNVDNPCNSDAQSIMNENWTIGDFIGLDNDGDNDFDSNDSDCGPANEPPIVTADEYTMEEDQQLSVPVPGVLDNDSDPDGDTITAILVEDVNNGTLTLFDDGSFNYNPKLDFFGTDSFTYRTDDGQLTSEIVTVTITVNNANDPPLADAKGPYSGAVGFPLSIDGSGTFDSDGTIVSYEWNFGDNSTGTGISPSHTYQTPGSFAITLKVTDNDGATDIATTIAEIAEQNQPPFAADDEYTANEDTQLSVPVPGVLGNDSDPDGNPITAILVSNTSNGNVTLNSDGSFKYDPDLNFAGTDHFTYVTNDGQLDSNIVPTVAITVNPVNDAPVAADDTFSASEAAQLNITAQSVLSNDNDPDGDPITAILVDDVTNGFLTLNEDGTFTYDPNPDFFGEDSFTYSANDGQLNSEVAKATITVNPPDVLDLDIAGFRVTKRISRKRVKPIEIRLVVRNNGSVNAEEKRSVTVVGMQNNVVVMRYDLEVSAGNRRTTLPIEPPYQPVAPGDIMWTVTIYDDDDTDADEATAVTKVVP